MSFIGSFGAFLGGATAEAAKIRQEREDKEQKNLALTMSILQNIIDNPQIDNPQLKQEAFDATRDVLMTHLFPGQFKAKGGKLSKLVEQFVGQNGDQQGAQLSGIVGQLGGEGRGEGAGRGKATSSVGGLNQPMRPNIPMPTPQAGAPLPPPIGMEGQDQMLAGGGPPPMPPDIQPQAPQQDIMTELPQGIRTSAGFTDSAYRTREAASSALLQGRIQNQLATEKASQGLNAFFQHPQVQGALKGMDSQQIAQIVGSSVGLNFTVLPNNQEYRTIETVDENGNEITKEFLIDRNGKISPLGSKPKAPSDREKELNETAQGLIASDPAFKGMTMPMARSKVLADREQRNKLESENLRNYRTLEAARLKEARDPAEQLMVQVASQAYLQAVQSAKADVAAWLKQPTQLTTDANGQSSMQPIPRPNESDLVKHYVNAFSPLPYDTVMQILTRGPAAVKQGLDTSTGTDGFKAFDKNTLGLAPPAIDATTPQLQPFIGTLDRSTPRMSDRDKLNIEAENVLKRMLQFNQ